MRFAELSHFLTDTDCHLCGQCGTNIAKKVVLHSKYILAYFPIV